MRMRLLRRLLDSRRHVAAMAVLALALQASSSGYVPACTMKAQMMSAGHACCMAAAAKACHMPMQTQRKACCFFGVLSPCADGAVSEARLAAPTATAALIAAARVMPDWAALAVPAQTAAPPVLEAPP